jgi:hypothetical protein
MATRMRRAIGRRTPGLSQALRRARERRLSRRYGASKPEVVVERTNLGPEMDKLVAELKRRQKPIGIDRDYDLVRENFDHLNYALQAQAKSRITPNDPIDMYLRNGADAINNPDINFSMREYLARYPEKRKNRTHPYLAWLRDGRRERQTSWSTRWSKGEPTYSSDFVPGRWGICGLGPPKSIHL